MPDFLKQCALLFLCMTTLQGAICAAESKPSDEINRQGAAILLYHHVSERTPPSTSISPERFAEHLAYIDQHHTVIALDVLIDAILTNQPLPENAVVITFDDGYRNIKENGHPLLKAYGFPYTIFINPALIGVEPQQLTWQDVKSLQQENVTFANHTLQHKHLLAGNDKENWLLNVLQDIHHAEQLLLEHTGQSRKFVAYPYGEYNQRLSDALIEKGYIGFGQHSGAVGPMTDLGAIPRFPAAGIYANLNTLKVKMNTLAMPVESARIKNPQLSFGQPMPTQTLGINLTDIHPNQVACFFENQPISTQWQGAMLSFSASGAISPGRTRINCTAPSKTYNGRFYWYSQPWFMPTKEGVWLD